MSAGLGSVRAGWRIVGAKRAHYFEGRHPLCQVGRGPIQIHPAWTAHQHAGRVPLCERCKRELERPRRVLL